MWTRLKVQPAHEWKQKLLIKISPQVWPFAPICIRHCSVAGNVFSLSLCVLERSSTNSDVQTSVVGLGVDGSCYRDTTEEVRVAVKYLSFWVWTFIWSCFLSEHRVSFTASQSGGIVPGCVAPLFYYFNTRSLLLSPHTTAFTSVGNSLCAQEATTHPVCCMTGKTCPKQRLKKSRNKEENICLSWWKHKSGLANKARGVFMLEMDNLERDGRIWPIHFRSMDKW